MSAQFDRYQIGDSVPICIKGFDPSSPVVVKVLLPGGQTRQHPLRNVNDQNEWLFVVGLADPTGSYAITAEQGPTSATDGFTAVLPVRPRVQTLDPTSGPPGTVFRFAVASPSPNQTLSIDLYRRERGRASFATTLGTVVTDSQARASYQVPTRTDSPAGEYCLLARPGECAFFTIR